MTAATTGSLFRRRNAWGRRRRGCGTAIVGARGGDNARSPGDAPTEHTVVQDQVDSRPRCQRGQPFEQFDRARLPARRPSPRYFIAEL